MQDWLLEGSLASKLLACRILADRAISLFSYTQWHEKTENAKHLEDEVTSLDFIYPEERDKQKQHILNSIQDNEQLLKNFNQK